MKIALIFLISALLLFALGYHYTDLAFNARYGAVDIGNNLDGPGLHMAGIQMLFLSAVLFSLAVVKNV